MKARGEIPNIQISQPPSPPVDPLGLDAWAAARGVPAHVALALAASTLAGIAGNSCAIHHTTMVFRNNGLNLLGIHGDPFVTTALDSLVGHAAKIQSELVHNSRRLPAALVDQVMYDPVVSNKNRDLLHEIAPSGGEGKYGFPYERLSSSMWDDRRQSTHELRYESLVRPWYLMHGTLPENLAKSLSSFHDGNGFSAGCLERLPVNESARRRRLDEILACIEGVTIDSPRGKSPTLANRYPVKFSGVIFLTASEVRRLIAERRDFIASVIPMPPVFPEVTGSPDLQEAREFQTRYHEVVEEVVSARRVRYPLSGWLSSDEMLGEFHSKQLGFARDLQALAEPLRITEAAKLPSLTTWTLQLLAGKRQIDDYIIKTAFDASRLILADAVNLLREHDQKELVENRLKVARKIVNRLTRIGPCKRRDLVRGLDRQALHLHEPVIAAMLRLGILTQSADRMLDFGGVSLMKLQASHLLDESP